MDLNKLKVKAATMVFESGAEYDHDGRSSAAESILRCSTRIDVMLTLGAYVGVDEARDAYNYWIGITQEG